MKQETQNASARCPPTKPQSMPRGERPFGPFLGSPILGEPKGEPEGGS